MLLRKGSAQRGSPDKGATNRGKETCAASLLPSTSVDPNSQSAAANPLDFSRLCAMMVDEDPNGSGTRRSPRRALAKPSTVFDEARRARLRDMSLKHQQRQQSVAPSTKCSEEQLSSDPPRPSSVVASGGDSGANSVGSACADGASDASDEASPTLVGPDQGLTEDRSTSLAPSTLAASVGGETSRRESRLSWQC